MSRRIERLEEMTAHPERNETENARVQDVRTAESYLEGLGLTWEQLQGKKILDIGADKGGFGRAANEHDIEVVSFEKMTQSEDPSLDAEQRNLKNRIASRPYVVGDARANFLPFTDGSFDVVLSSAAPPSIFFKREQVMHLLEEIRRVLKPGGEFRMSGFLNVSRFKPEKGDELDVSNPPSMEVAQKEALEFLQEFDSTFTLEPSVERKNNISDGYFRMQKTQPEDYQKR